jgi:hypothetical protein
LLVLLEGGGEVVADRLSEQQPTDLLGHQVGMHADLLLMSAFDRFSRRQ